METKKLERIILLILVLLNLVLLFLLLRGRIEEASARRARLESLTTLLAERGITLGPDADLEQAGLPAYTVQRDLALEDQRMQGILGAHGSEDQGGGIWYYHSERAKIVMHGTGELTILPLGAWGQRKGTPYEQACDIVQESFIRVWQHRDKLTAEDSISGLVFRIAKNIKIDNFRKYRKEVLVEEYEDSVVPAVEDNQENSPEDTQYLRSCINKALDSLNKDLRTCYTLYNVGEMPIKDIAEMLGISESLVKVRIHRAKLFLAEKLQYLRDQGDF